MGQNRKKHGSVMALIFNRYNAITPRATHRRPEDHAQAKIDAEARRERRRRKRAADFAWETHRAETRKLDIRRFSQMLPRQMSAFDYLVKAGLVRS